MSKQNNKPVIVIIAEYEGNWIQHHNYKDEGFEAYDLFLIDNLTMVTMSPEAFEKLRVLFRMLESKENKTPIC